MCWSLRLLGSSLKICPKCIWRRGSWSHHRPQLWSHHRARGNFVSYYRFRLRLLQFCYLTVFPLVQRKHFEGWNQSNQVLCLWYGCGFWECRWLSSEVVWKSRYCQEVIRVRSLSWCSKRCNASSRLWSSFLSILLFVIVRDLAFFLT